MEQLKASSMAQGSLTKVAAIMIAITIVCMTKTQAQNPASQNTALKYMADTTYVTGKSPANPINHLSENSTLKSVIDYALFIHQFDSLNLGAGISGSEYKIPVFTSHNVIGNGSITDSTGTHYIIFADTARFKGVPYALNPGDSIAVIGTNQGTLRKVAPPTAVPPLYISWPQNHDSLGTVSVPNGGTGITSYTVAGAIPYSTSSTTMTYMPAGNTGQLIGNSGGTPVWVPMPVSSVSATSGGGINFTVTNPTTTPVISASLVPTGVSAGAYGTVSAVPTYSVNVAGQMTACATVPISISSSQINNIPTSLWVVGGNSVTATSVLGTSSSNSLAIETNGLARDSIGATNGVTYLIGDTAAANTTIMAIRSKYEATYQTKSMFFGIGKGNNYPLNVPYINFGTTDAYNNPQFNSTGFNDWSQMVFQNAATTPILVRGATPTAGGASFWFTAGGYAGGNAATSGSFSIVSAGQDDGSQNFWFRPTTGTANYYAFSDHSVIAQSVTATGVTSSYTNAEATIQGANNYRCFYATNTIGYSFYSSSAPAYINATVSSTHDKGIGSSPTVAAGTGAGTSPTVSILTGSTDKSGWVSITTGSSPVASATVATITFSAAYGITPKVQLSPANVNASALSGTGSCWADYAGSSTAGFPVMVGSTALAGSTTYIFEYRITE